MANSRKELNLTKKELTEAFSDPYWSKKFPPLMTIGQAAELLQIPKATIYEWRSRGRLQGCCRKVGKHLRFFRDRLVTRLFNEGI